MRSYQLAAFDARQAGCKRFVSLLHRRAGKDRGWASITLAEMLKRVGVYFHVYPSLNQGRRDFWDNVLQERHNGIERSFKMRDMFPAEFVLKQDETDMQTTLTNGSIHQIMGADTDDAVDRLRGPGPIGIVLSEYAHGTKMEKAWNVLAPILNENNGWIAFAYTPNGRNHGLSLYEFASKEPDWFVQRLTVDETRRDAEGEDNSRVISQESIDADRRRGVREEFIQQEYYCSFEGFMHGTIYGDLVSTAVSDGRIGEYPYNPRLPVGLCFDLGHSDATACWFYQLKGDQIIFIDYHEEKLKDLGWWNHYLREQKRYVYGRTILPWDGHAAEQFLGQVGFSNIHVCQRTPNLQSEIDRVRRAFSSMYFDARRCARGIECLTNYKRKYDEDLKEFQKNPIHDEYSHGADALRTGVSGGFTPMLYSPDYNSEIKVESQFDPRSVGGPSVFTP